MTPTPMSRGDYVSLKEHLESRIEAVEKAIVVAEKSLGERLAGMNEIREAMRNQSAYFVTRAEMEAKIDVLHNKVEALEKCQATMEGKTSQSQGNVTLFFAVTALILGVATFILNILQG